MTITPIVRVVSPQEFCHGIAFLPSESSYSILNIFPKFCSQRRVMWQGGGMGRGGRGEGGWGGGRAAGVGCGLGVWWVLRMKVDERGTDGDG